MSDPEILIIGAGLGGLTAALALQKSGHRVAVFDQVPELGEIGAGIMLTPNASRVLLNLGLGPTLEREAFVLASTMVRDGQTGAILSDTPIGSAFTKRHGAPYYIIHRANLHRGLSEAVRAQDPNCIRLSHAFTSFQASDTSVTAHFANGRKASGAVLIGADGIKSKVRAQIAADAPVFTGNIAWRGLVPMEKLSAKERPLASMIWVGPGRHFVHYTVKGGTLMNYVAIAEQSAWQDDGWMIRADVGDALACFAEWHEEVRDIIANTPADACYKWGLFDRDPLPRWTDGRVTLLGDAAHPMLPFMAQGAAMAIEDGAVLSRALTRSRNLVDGLLDYEALRLPRTSWVQDQSRRNQRLYHDSTKGADFDADRAMRAERLYDYDAMAV